MDPRIRQLCLPLLVLAGCSSSDFSMDATFAPDAGFSMDGAPSPDGSADELDGGIPSMDAQTGDAERRTDGGPRVDGSTSMDASGGMDASSGGYDGGPFMCSAPAPYNTNNGGGCGSYRWSVKVGTDSAANGVALTPTETTIGALGQLPVPPGLGTSLPRTAQENTLYILRNITVIETKREPDSDYHMPIKDPATNATMEAEIPFPSCGNVSSPFYCFNTHSRASLERIITPTGSYQQVNQVATVVGPALFDMLHGSANSAPNGIEIHPVIALCFGMDCDPTSN